MMHRQITDCVFMVRPLHFCMNEQTAITNHFQQHEESCSQSDILTRVQGEFDGYVHSLRDVGVNVIVIEDRPDVITPDSIFPNNWIVTDQTGNVSLFPMCAPNRRLERRFDIIDRLKDNGYRISDIIDFTKSEESNEKRYLEGTGSMILDRQHHRAYCALSPRSDEELFREFCTRFGYDSVVFTAYQTLKTGNRAAIYHTNVMLTIAESFAVICLDCIDDVNERNQVVEALVTSGKEIIEISEDQVASFAGNMLQLCNDRGERFLVMSQTAHHNLNNTQLLQITKHCKILSIDIAMIEKLGGGSARCMLAEVFLPKL